MMLGWAFFDPSPNEYITTPQATAQYGQVLRVSVVRRSLNSRTSATATEAEKPMSARLEPASVAPVIFRNWRLVSSVMRTPSSRVQLRRSLFRLMQRLQVSCALPRCIAAVLFKASHLSTSVLQRKLMDSGMEVSRRVLQIRPDIPVLLATGYVRNEDVEQARSIGIREVIWKPQTIGEMGDLLAQQLEKLVPTQS